MVPSELEMPKDSLFATDYSLRDTKIVNARGLKLAEPLRFAKKYGSKKSYEPLSLELWEQLIRKGDVICDVGAHHGIYSLLAARSGEAKAIYAYEPVKDNLAFLKNNARLNKLGAKITTRNSALSNQIGETQFQITEASDNANIKGHPNSPTLRATRVETSTLDADFRNSKLDLIKIDTDGYEPYILDGAIKTFKNNPQLRMLIEFNPKCLRKNQYSPLKFLERLVDLNFELLLIDDTNDTILRITNNKRVWRMIESTPSYYNILCLPAAFPQLQTFIDEHSQTQKHVKNLEKILQDTKNHKKIAEAKLERIYSTKTWRYIIRPTRRIFR